MQRYRENAAGFNAANAAVFGVSVDSTWANKAFRDQVGVDFPILSDSKKEYSRKLGILNEESGTARRTTFVIDADGVIQHIEEGNSAIDPTGAVSVCSMLKTKETK